MATKLVVRSRRLLVIDGAMMVVVGTVIEPHASCKCTDIEEIECNM